jgi:hypothetical protein
MDYDGEEYIILAYGEMTIIGRKGGDGGEIINPRSFQMVRRGNDVGLVLSRLIGAPSRIRIPKGALWYKVEDTKFIDLYVQETTGIIVNGGLVK